MTTTVTMDTQGTIDQAIRLIEAGCELVRVTAPSIREAKNLALIRSGLRERGYTVPLVADIHFTPNAAEVAARIVEKVRVNPGNYIDRKQFAVVNYSDEDYATELARLRARFTPLVRICKEYGTAMRIGTNHGSLSDRIVNRYGDNPLGMVESALEFLHIAEDEGYENIVLSMKSSNPIVMIEAYRLLVFRLQTDGCKPYPLHLGVTEAGDGEDGRLKSGIGIGTLLEDGLGDTVRVSLTEEPEAEIPVARALVARYAANNATAVSDAAFGNIHYQRTHSIPVAVIGGDHVPRVFADLRNVKIEKPEDLACIGHYFDPMHDKWTMSDLGAEFIYMGDRVLPFMPPAGIRQIVRADVWQNSSDKLFTVPVWSVQEYLEAAARHSVLNVVACDASVLSGDALRSLAAIERTVLLVRTSSPRMYHAYRILFATMKSEQVCIPVVLHANYGDSAPDDVLLRACTDVGSTLADGLGDGVMISLDASVADSDVRIAFCTRLSFGLSQATRLRMSKTEYISCPSCGRTLFDLQETTSLIRSHTDHLKSVKIGIMGCIVNGPGEMADADYGYVGSGPSKITLYRGQDVVKRSVPTDQAVTELINIIKSDGRWIER